MFIQLQPQYLTIWELELELFAIEPRIVLVDNPVVVRTYNNDVRRVVVLRMGEIVDGWDVNSEHTDTGKVIPSLSNDQSTVFCNMNPLS